MGINSYMEEFNRRYNQPRMNRVTVGFSGIDPDEKQLNDTQKGEVSELAEQHYQEKLEAIQGIDCGIIE